MTIISDGHLNHFWSINGVECLWCGRERSPEEIALWTAAGEPDEECPHIGRLLYGTKQPGPHETPAEKADRIREVAAFVAEYNDEKDNRVSPHVPVIK